MPIPISVKLDTQVLNNSAAAMVGTIQQVMTYPPEPKVKDNRFDTAGSYIYADNALHSDKVKDVANCVQEVRQECPVGRICRQVFLECHTG